MTRLSDSGRSLRPDGQLRSTNGLQLLSKWEVKSAGVPMQEAVEDLKSESSNPNAGGFCIAIKGRAAASQLACHSSAMLLPDSVNCMPTEE